LCVKIAEERITQRMLEKQKLFDPAHPHHSLLKEFLLPWDWVSTDQIPEREFIDCSTKLVESVALDPRCPPHKARFISAWFRERGIRVDNSTCFGYLPNTFSVFPDK
ncbi:hypothetical protein, partial [Comamonas jiangduensis]|uniref:hypothetical protein n=1 Tax=Comamonas jiangduensis TaxID=1194168 RepID=UPI0024E193ED